MTVVTQSKIPFTAENIMKKCICGQCPVQSSSKCVKSLEPIEEAVKNDPIEREDIAGMYCASGKAFCDDLDFKNACVCGTCVLFNEEYHLADNHPSGYFCKGGRAE
jgi:hypothetical protein